MSASARSHRYFQKIATIATLIVLVATLIALVFTRRATVAEQEQLTNKGLPRQRPSFDVQPLKAVGGSWSVPTPHKPHMTRCSGLLTARNEGLALSPDPDPDRPRRIRGNVFSKAKAKARPECTASISWSSITNVCRDVASRTTWSPSAPGGPGIVISFSGDTLRFDVASGPREYLSGGNDRVTKSSEAFAQEFLAEIRRHVPIEVFSKPCH